MKGGGQPFYEVGCQAPAVLSVNGRRHPLERLVCDPRSLKVHSFHFKTSSSPVLSGCDALGGSEPHCVSDV